MQELSITEVFEPADSLEMMSETEIEGLNSPSRGKKSEGILEESNDVLVAVSENGRIEEFSVQSAASRFDGFVEELDRIIRKYVNGKA